MKRAAIATLALAVLAMASGCGAERQAKCKPSAFKPPRKVRFQDCTRLADGSTECKCTAISWVFDVHSKEVVGVCTGR